MSATAKVNGRIVVQGRVLTCALCGATTGHMVYSTARSGRRFQCRNGHDWQYPVR